MYELEEKENNITVDQCAAMNTYWSYCALER